LYINTDIIYIFT